MLFQYQQLATPFTQEVAPPPPPLPELTWLPHFPDSVPHRRSILAPFYIAAPFETPGVLPVRVSQLPIEHVFQYGAVLARASQVPVETVFQYAIAIRQTRVSQLAVEICYPFGCYIYVPPLPNPCPVPADGPVGGPACTAPAPGAGN